MYKFTVTKSIEIDEYLQGCTMDSYQDFGEIYSFKGNNLSDILKHFGKEKQDLYFFDGKIEFTELENGDGFSMSQREVELWKNNKIKGYLATYSLFIEKVEQVTNNIFNLEEH